STSRRRLVARLATAARGAWQTRTGGRRRGPSDRELRYDRGGSAPHPRGGRHHGRRHPGTDVLGPRGPQQRQARSAGEARGRLENAHVARGGNRGPRGGPGIARPRQEEGRGGGYLLDESRRVGASRL